MKYLLTVIVMLTAGLVQAATVNLPKGGVLALENGTRYLIPAGARLEIPDDDPLPEPPTVYAPHYGLYVDPCISSQSWVFYPSLYSDYWYDNNDDEPYVYGWGGNWCYHGPSYHQPHYGYLTPPGHVGPPGPPHYPGHDPHHGCPPGHIGPPPGHVGPPPGHVGPPPGHGGSHGGGGGHGGGHGGHR
jgi:hypothetical protein